MQAVGGTALRLGESVILVNCVGRCRLWSDLAVPTMLLAIPDPKSVVLM